MSSLRMTCMVALAAVSACSAENDPGRQSAGASSHARIRVVVEQGEAGETRVLGDARFLRYRDLEREVADVLAGSEPRSGLILGRCDAAGADARLGEALASLPQRAVLHYMDAGDVVLRAAGAEEILTPHDRPALFPYVAGIEYAPTALEGALELPRSGGEVGVTGLGADEVGPFDVTANLPALPEGLGARPAADPSDLEVVWEPRDHPRGAIVSVRAGGRELRCRTEDDGELVLAASVLSYLPADAWMRVAVERWRRTEFSAAGLDQGELEVAVRAVTGAGIP